ncbi:MAG: DUF2520 domain-containing protein [Planctomycetota bacterium]
MGQALGRRLREGGVELLGFLGEDPRHSEQAVAFAGGRVLHDAGELAAADAVMIAVQDDVLVATAADLATSLAGFSGLCFHVSGAHDLLALAPLAAAGAQVGSLHPLCPVPDAATGYGALPGQPAVIEATAKALHLLQDLANRAGLQPVVMAAGDRLLYHTACVLAANGLTALYATLEELFAKALQSDDRDDARRLPAALMQKALATCAQHGATAALSGPVPRCDSELIHRQLHRLEATDVELADLYRLLMTKAVAMAAHGGALDADAVARLRSALRSRPRKEHPRG